MANLPVNLFESLTFDPLKPAPIVSDKTKGTGYYGRSSGMHTVQYSTANGFTGVVKLQASLEHSPTDDDWFDVDDTTIGGGDPLVPVADGAQVLNFIGNFVWVRAVITQFTAGSLNRVLLTHN